MTTTQLKNECSICCNDKIIIPCGSFNNCKALVCDNCFYNKKTIETCEYMSYRCLYCNSYDYKKGVMEELRAIFDVSCDIGNGNNYVLNCITYKKDKNFFDFIIEEPDIHMYQFCYACD